MIICLLCGACVLYNGIYLAHCIKHNRIKAAVGTGAVIALVAAGVLLLGFDTAW